MHLLAVLAASQPALEFVGGRLQRAVEGLRAALPADHRTAPGVGGDLDMLAVLALATVVLVGEFDVEAMDRVVNAFGAGELVSHVDPKVVGNLDVAPGHLEVRCHGGVGAAGVRVGRVGAGAVGGELGRTHGLG